MQSRKGIFFGWYVVAACFVTLFAAALDTLLADAEESGEFCGTSGGVKDSSPVHGVSRP